MLYFLLSTVLAASNLEFDDSEKQRKFKTISFEEVHNEVNELKVVKYPVNLLIFGYI